MYQYLKWSEVIHTLVSSAQRVANSLLSLVIVCISMFIVWFIGYCMYQYVKWPEVIHTLVSSAQRVANSLLSLVIVCISMFIVWLLYVPVCKVTGGQPHTGKVTGGQPHTGKVTGGQPHTGQFGSTHC